LVDVLHYVVFGLGEGAEAVGRVAPACEGRHFGGFVKSPATSLCKLPCGVSDTVKRTAKPALANKQKTGRRRELKPTGSENGSTALADLKVILHGDLTGVFCFIARVRHPGHRTWARVIGPGPRTLQTAFRALNLGSPAGLGRPLQAMRRRRRWSNQLPRNRQRALL
jgi:hypothetical protein